MKRLSEVDTSDLRWTRTGEGHTYRLVSGSEAVASLHWQKSVGSLATAETAEGRWTLKRGGFMSPTVSVRDAEHGQDLAILHVHWNVSTLTARGGAVFRWTRIGFWVPAWQVTDQAGAELVHFEPVRKDSHLEGGLALVAPRGRTIPELLLLLVLGWYFIVLAWIEDQAVAASGRVLAATAGA